MGLASAGAVLPRVEERLVEAGVEVLPAVVAVGRLKSAVGASVAVLVERPAVEA